MLLELRWIKKTNKVVLNQIPILTYYERRLDLEVESHTELPHLVPGRAAVLTSVTGLGGLYEQHVGQGVEPGPVVDWLEEVAVHVEPAQGGRRD